MPEKDTLILHNIGRLYSFPGEGPVGGEAMSSPSILENAALTARSDRISMVGKETTVWKKADLAKNARCIDCNGKAVVPGFVDPHTHALFGGTREFELALKLKGSSYMDIHKAGGGILRTMRDTRGLSIKNLTSILDSRLDIMMRYGTTTAEVKSGYGLDADTELKLLKAVKASEHPVERVSTFMGPHAVPPEFKDRPDKFLEQMIDLLPYIAKQGLAEFADIFCETGVFTAVQAEKFLSAAKRNGLKLKVHSDELENIGGTIVGAALGAVSADHLLFSGTEELRALRRAGTVPVLLPGTLFTLFEKRIPRFKEMVEIGLPVAIATDLNPNCMVHSMQFVQALACYRMGMTPEQVLAASTVNAAHAVSLSGRKGRIAPGYDADVLVLKDSRFEHVVYQMGVNHIDTVVIGGKARLTGIGW